jgi:hypothetical protein
MKANPEIQPGQNVLTEGEPAEVPAGRPLTVEHAEKGSLRSMWELLMQLRVLLPYLSRLVPLLDRGLLKASPDLTEFRKELQDVHTGSRDLGIQVRNQALHLERLEEQILRLHESSERNLMETRALSGELVSLTARLRFLTGLVLAVLLVLVALWVSRWVSHTSF